MNKTFKRSLACIMTLSLSVIFVSVAMEKQEKFYLGHVDENTLWKKAPKRGLVGRWAMMPATPLETAINADDIDAAYAAIHDRLAWGAVNRQVASSGYPGHITMVGLAIRHDSLPMVTLLVQNDAEVYPYDVVRAYLRNNEGILTYLLEQPSIKLRDFFDFLDREKQDPEVKAEKIEWAEAIARKVAQNDVKKILHFATFPAVMWMTAVPSGEAVFTSLIEKLGPQNAHDEQGNNPLHVAVVSLQSLPLLEWLGEKYPEFLKQANKAGDTPLQLAWGLWGTSADFRDLVYKLRQKGLITQADIDLAQTKLRQFHAKERREEMATQTEAQEKKEEESKI